VTLTGYAIDEAVKSGRIKISPYDSGQIRYEIENEFGQINPASYDLRLGSTVAVYNYWVKGIDREQRFSEEAESDGRFLSPCHGAILDIREEPTVTKFKIGEAGWLLYPGIGYLMCTKERIDTGNYVGLVGGKSSIGRLFIEVHRTAGYVDPAFDGEITLEVTATHAIRVYADMLFAQIWFEHTEGKVMPYRGNYRGDAAIGPVASRAHMQFKKAT
jgi:dCTP deaminase